MHLGMESIGDFLQPFFSSWDRYVYKYYWQNVRRYAVFTNDHDAWRKIIGLADTMLYVTISYSLK